MRVSFGWHGSWYKERGPASIRFHRSTNARNGRIKLRLYDFWGRSLDDTQRIFYGLKFENTFMRQKGKAFEVFFARAMAHGFVGDFEPVRPYGPNGDLKCDGYRPSDGTVFQSYAPDTTKLAELLGKIDQDFRGAMAHWGDKMRRWEFVHNDVRGLPAAAINLLEELRATHPNIEIAVLGELRKAAKEGGLGRYFGAAADLRTRLTIAEARARRLRDQVARFNVVPEYAPRPIRSRSPSPGSAGRSPRPAARPGSRSRRQAGGRCRRRRPGPARSIHRC